MTLHFDIDRGIRMAPDMGAGANIPPAPPKPPAPPAPPTPPKSDKLFGGGFKGLRVSLMPVDEAKGRPDLRKRLIILAIVLVAELLLIGGIYLLLVQRERSQQAALESLRAQQQSLDAAIAHQEADAAELAGFSLQVMTIKDRLDHHIHWTNVMTLLEQHALPSVRFTNFSGGLSTRVVAVSAIAPTYRDMAEQIVAFRKAPMVISVRAPAGVSVVDAGGGLVSVRWDMILDLSPEIWTAAAKTRVLNPAAAMAPAATITTP